MINHIINWISENREWFFSGIGVTLLLWIIAFFRKKSECEKCTKIEQNSEGQNNTQIGIQNNYYGGTKNDN